MKLFERLKGLFSSKMVPDADRRAYAQAKDIPGLMKQLEGLTTANEVMLRQIRASISKLELTEKATITSIKRGNITGRGVRLALQTINRYRKQLDGLEHKADIINKNLTLHINLMSKVELMEAMELKGVAPELIDQVILEFTENVEKYQVAFIGEESIVAPDKAMLSEKERGELAELEKEVFGEVKHFAKGSVKTNEQPDVVEDEQGEFEPLPTEDEIKRTIEKSERMIRDFDSGRELETE